MDSLEREVYAVDSPIWNPNFLNTSFPKKVLGMLFILVTQINNFC